MPSGKQARRTIYVGKGTGDELRVLWLLYYKVSTITSSSPFWGLTPGIITELEDAAERLSAQFGVVLLSASSEVGYLLTRGHLQKGASRWPTGRDGQFKVKEREIDVSGSIRFGSLRGLASVLGIPKTR